MSASTFFFPGISPAFLLHPPKHFTDAKSQGSFPSSLLSIIFKPFVFSEMAQITYSDISIGDMVQACTHDYQASEDFPDPNSLELELESRESSILISGCAFCREQSGKLYDCGHCRPFTYCCKDHFLRDRASHGEFCDLIEESRLRVKELKHELVADNEDPFHNHLGHFWGFPKTKDFLLELSKLVELHEPIKHRTAVVRQLVFAFHIMYMGGTDDLDFRFKVPALMMRINRDQECYDFMKWRNALKRECLTKTSLEHMRVRFANPEIFNSRIPDTRRSSVGYRSDPRQDPAGYRRENVLESPAIFDEATPVMTLIPLCLVKIKFILEIQRLQLAAEANADKPLSAIVDTLKKIPHNDSIAERDKLMRSEDKRRTAINKLKGHVLELYRRVRDRNPLVWKGILGWALEGEGMDLADGDTKEVKFNRESWVETPGAIPLLREIMVEEEDL